MLQLTASAVVKGNAIFATASINVNIPTVDIPATAGATFEDPDTGVLWRVLVPDDGNGNALIITENVHGYGTQYNGIGAIGTVGTYALYENTNHLKPAMDAWYNNTSNVGSTIRSIALDYAYTNGNKGVVGAGVEYNSPSDSWDQYANVDRAKTVAGAPTTLGNGKVFPLSVSEANTYFISREDRNAKDVSGTDHTWWLRSPGHSIYSPASFVYSGGAICTDSAMNTDMSVGFRPALWVRK